MQLHFQVQCFRQKLIQPTAVSLIVKYIILISYPNIYLVI